ncbi:hypothetical protein SAMN05428945_1958 [Streptomyces sp. 2224.1]|uniref:hypothetical protein n=1 Tax=unclassified Streptomyces TaxID=2593676 RepID=UPI00087FC2F3|nr:MULTISPECIES: hypothetical protein [unclassified Streptomyces]SDR42727.1 hypothetical protein SAMN05216511_3855 [Streptomyces sp. KS_16]SEC07485.1 hypothetical protein SAMN05428945_1958 [Streptomyces sp. 2224.1]SEC95389.1 hypothetical protein SAMN05428940_3349 [Streptomyces sp. 2133.1]SEE78752.1 hypothetical protein SAMN05428954_3883 [Streptomyces sp. 2112.3]SNC69480.1 hypothetical protein SAMN06272741_3340 [Streptomyces sp. 2114.4]
MNSVRVTAIACLMPLSELDEDPFLVDDRGQHDMCTQWAAARDYHLTCRLSLHHLRADHGALWRDVEAGLVDVFVAPNRRALENAIDNAAEFTARCAEAGVRLETTDLDEPVYTLAMKSQVHRRLSMPTAGYNGC